MKHLFSYFEASETIGAPEALLMSFRQQNWITEWAPENSETPIDLEDLTRMRFIVELKRDFEVNDESIPIILHLMDQLNYLRNQLKQGVLCQKKIKPEKKS